MMKSRISVRLLPLRATVAGGLLLTLVLTSVETFPKTSTKPTLSPSISSAFRDDEENALESLMRECSSSNDCTTSFCCTVGMMRYSIPTCLPMGQLGDSCIPRNRPDNFTLSYPNGETREALQSYRIICPCATGLSCDVGSSTCVPSVKRSTKKDKKDGGGGSLPRKFQAERETEERRAD